MISGYIYFILLVELFVIAYFDIKTRKVSNRWPLINIILFIVVYFTFPGSYLINQTFFYYPVAFFIGGFALFVLRIMGAGDTKYLSSLFILVPLSLQDLIFLHLVYLTLLVGLFLLTYNTLWNLARIRSAFILRDISLIKGVYGKSKFAYTPVIMMTWIWFGVVHWKKVIF